MMNQKHYEKAKKYYEDGVWTITMLRNVVGKWITEEQFEEITGQPYSE